MSSTGDSLVDGIAQRKSQGGKAGVDKPSWLVSPNLSHPCPSLPALSTFALLCKLLLFSETFTPCILQIYFRFLKERAGGMEGHASRENNISRGLEMGTKRYSEKLAYKVHGGSRSWVWNTSAEETVLYCVRKRTLLLCAFKESEIADCGVSCKQCRCCGCEPEPGGSQCEGHWEIDLAMDAHCAIVF